MKNLLLILASLFSLHLKAQSDTVLSDYEFTLTGIYNSVNDMSRTTLTMSAKNSIKWKKFESMVSTDYQLVSDDNINSVSKLVKEGIFFNKYFITCSIQQSLLI